MENTMRFAPVRPGSPRAMLAISPFRAPILVNMGRRGEVEDRASFSKNTGRT